MSSGSVTAAVATLIAAGLFTITGCAGPEKAPATVHIDKASAFRMVEEIVSIGPRPSGSAGARKTAQYLAAKCTEFGYDPIVDAWRADTPRGPVDFQNVYADLPGTESGMIIIGSHFDTKHIPASPSFQGANDSGSSTGLLLEIMRSLATAGWRGPTLRFAFFDGEEAVVNYTDRDGLYGSRRMAAELHRDGKVDQCRAMILIDMIGDADLTITLSPNDDANLISLALEIADEQNVRKHIDFFLYGSIIDDHVPFKELGIPAIDFIDFSYGPNNAYWHTERDTLDKLSADSLEIVGNLIIALVARL